MSSPIEITELEQYCQEGFGLNIGCGDRQLGNSVGLDVNPNAGAAKIIADSVDLPIKDGCLDYIVSCHSLEHTMFAPLIVLREWLRCLRVGGILAVVVPDGSDGEIALQYCSKAGQFPAGGHTHLFTTRQLSDLVSFAGSTVLRHESLDRRPYWRTNALLVVAQKDDSYKPGVAKRSKLLWFRSIWTNALPAAYLGRLRKSTRW